MHSMFALSMRHARFDHWNIHKFYDIESNVTELKMDLLGEIDSHGKNTFSMRELRIISPQPQHAIAVPAVHVGPGT